MEVKPRIAYQPALDGLRAFAVLAVMAYHFEPSWLRGGFLGVDTFFVLSGFLITSLLLAEWGDDGSIRLRAFWGRRARRLLPALLLVLAGVSLAAMAWTPAALLGRFRADGLAGLFYSANWRLVASGQSYFDLFATPSPLRHLWSLAIEEQFYLVWPLVVLGALTVARGSRRLLGAICLGGIVGSVVLMAALYESGDPSRAYYGTDTRAHALLVGAALALLSERRAKRASRASAKSPGGGMRAVGWAAFVLCGLACVAVGDRSPWLYHGGLLLFAVTTAIVIASPPAVLRVRPLRWIGRVSYGLYLWHWPVAVYLTAARVGVSGLRLDGVRVAATFGLATASYYLVEQPIRRGALRGRFAIGVAPSAVVATGAVVLFATSAAVPLPSYYQMTAAPTAPAAAQAGSPAALSAPSVLAASERPAPRPAPPASTAASAAETTTSLTPPASSAAGTDAANSAGDTGAFVAPPPQRVLLVGDSVAYTLQDGLQSAFEARGISFASGAIVGCGAVVALVSDEQGKPFDWAASCEDAVANWQHDSVARFHPDLIVWLSTWETSPRVVDGKVLRIGDLAGNQEMLTEVEASVARLRVEGARLLFLVPAPTVESYFDPDAVPSDGEYGPLAHVFRAVANRDPEHIAVADLAAVVCDGQDPCPTEVDGVRLRPVDGRHFVPETAPLVAGPIVDLILNATWRPDPAPGTPTPATRVR